MRFLLSITLAVQAVAIARVAPDPLDIFRPIIVVRPAQRQALDSGTPIITLPPAQGRELAVFSAIAIDNQAPKRRASRWIRQIEQLRRNPSVVSTGRFSTPIAATDIEGLTLDARDVDDIRSCRPGHCNVKLSASEVLELQRVIAASGADWRTAVQRAFQAIVLRRVSAYVSGGHAGLEDYADHRVPRSPVAAFRLVAGSAGLEHVAPGILDDVSRCPTAFLGPHRGFIYWSKEQLGGKSVISATHAVLIQPDPGSAIETLVVGIQIFATHYLDASLELTGVLRSADRSRRYLVHVHSSEVDLLDGFWGGLARSAIASRIRKDGPAALEAARHRLSAVDPPSP